MIDVRDIVACTEKVILSNEYDNQIFELTGPDSIGINDVASSLSMITGQRVNCVPVPLEAVEQSIKDMGVGDWFAEIMRDYSKA